ncbi:class II aldolase/adducin family protein [Stappia sp. TSB10GB4]|uniref:class II aldolase/adducin family protein n=1 Tax=Stappia sp. TSB10GB4 TaxID=2003584 RepID=UPI00164428B5|nr:class II aldolase/adducin family protein [Stappia sp. TSB10GB4]
MLSPQDLADGPADDLAARRAIIDACLKMNATGLNQGTAGNISLRHGEGFLVTPSGIPYEAMRPEQVVPVHFDESYSGDWLPSSEWRMHFDIYATRPEAGAVVHTHSVHATALSCLRREIPPFHYMIAVAGGRTLRTADYATFGTRELSRAMLAALEGRSACLLANHGMICFGPTLDKALWLAGEVETLCRQYVIALTAGEPAILTDTQMDEVIARFGSYGRQPGEVAAGAVPAVEAPRHRPAS